MSGSGADVSTVPAGTYFEDFAPGQIFRHMRGKTLGEMDVVVLSMMVMNTAQGHFNADVTTQVKFGRRVTFGGITASLVIGLASQDTSENAIAELGVDKIRLKQPVFEGDTLYAMTETCRVEPSEQPDRGVVHFRHTGINQRRELVCEIERRVLIRRREVAGNV